MSPDFLQPWNNFFSAELGAAAALTGLLFVAVSINLARILQFPHLPARAAEALLDLLSVMIVSTFALIPRQGMINLGIEIAATGFFLWISHTVALTRARKFDRAYVRLRIRLLVNQLPPLPFIVAGMLLVFGRPSGMYWIVPGTLLSFAAGIFGAWVLLVEIQR
ncbi:MAG TPA: hypothetical protein VHW45_09685 [Candidatus Sulfotelmatobacter sp.]|jgi:modulator of FtsH protease|nr:hypothetical protein [Candidatus Sulfotelmatobacter sp.]